MMYEVPNSYESTPSTLPGMSSRLDSRCMRPRLCSALTVATLVPWAESRKIKSE